MVFKGHIKGGRTVISKKDIRTYRRSDVKRAAYILKEDRVDLSTCRLLDMLDDAEIDSDEFCRMNQWERLGLYNGRVLKRKQDEDEEAEVINVSLEIVLGRDVEKDEEKRIEEEIALWDMAFEDSAEVNGEEVYDRLADAKISFDQFAGYDRARRFAVYENEKPEDIYKALAVIGEIEKTRAEDIKKVDRLIKKDRYDDFISPVQLLLLLEWRNISLDEYFSCDEWERSIYYTDDDDSFFEQREERIREKKTELLYDIIEDDESDMDSDMLYDRLCDMNIDAQAFVEWPYYMRWSMYNSDTYYEFEKEKLVLENMLKEKAAEVKRVENIIRKDYKAYADRAVVALRAMDEAGLTVGEYLKWDSFDREILCVGCHLDEMVEEIHQTMEEKELELLSDIMEEDDVYDYDERIVLERIRRRGMDAEAFKALDKDDRLLMYIVDDDEEYERKKKERRLYETEHRNLIKKAEAILFEDGRADEITPYELASRLERRDVDIDDFILWGFILRSFMYEYEDDDEYYGNMFERCEDESDDEYDEDEWDYDEEEYDAEDSSEWECDPSGRY